MKFVKKCSQIRSLFDDLKIPQRDRRFFTKTFMARYDERSSAFVDEQLEILQNHRHHTLRVLACIRRRETSIKQLHAVVKACVIALVTPEMERSRGRGGRGDSSSYYVCSFFHHAAPFPPIQSLLLPLQSFFYYTAAFAIQPLLLYSYLFYYEASYKPYSMNRVLKGLP